MLAANSSVATAIRGRTALSRHTMQEILMMSDRGRRMEPDMVSRDPWM